MTRILARPPKLTLATSFREAYSTGRFLQLDLITEADLIREARDRGLRLGGASQLGRSRLYVEQHTAV